MPKYDLGESQSTESFMCADLSPSIYLFT